jgi:stage II sporulation protein M
MQVNKINGGFGRHFEINFWLYVVSLLCFSTGIVLGIYTVRYMGGPEMSDLSGYFSSFINTLTDTEINNKYVLYETIKNNMPMLIALWLLGLTMVGIPIILIIDIIKGFTLGFTISFIISSTGIKGLWMILVGVVPQNVIYIPCLIVASVLGMELSMTKLKDRFNRQTSRLMDSRNISYSITFLIIILVMILGFIYEAYITPKAMELIIGSIGSVLV